MHHFLYALFIALTNNVDNIGARFAYSLGGIKISIPINFWITVVTFVISFIAAFSGTKLSGAMGETIFIDHCHGDPIAIGVWMSSALSISKKKEQGKLLPRQLEEYFLLIIEA